MIREEICTYEVAKLAKEKGYPQKFNYSKFTPRYNYYNHKGELHGDVKDILKLRLKHEPIPEEMEPITAPTQSLLQRWLRETHAIDIDIYPIFPAGESHNREYGCQVYAVGKSNKPFRIGYAKTYENMLDKALKYALENLI